MARVTEAQRIEQANEEAARVFFREALSSLPDPRRAQGIRYPLMSVVVIALMAMVCGSDDAEAMEVWGEANARWLGGILELPHGTPTQDVFLSVFAALDPVAFRSVFLSWMELLRLRLRVMGKHIAIDGKTSRRSFDTARDRPAIHTVSAWLSDEGLVLGQIKTADKSNEITAIPELLRVIDLRGATVTIDAIGCQTEIAKNIVGGEGHYLLAVKENQPALYKDLAATFAEVADNRVRSVDERARPMVEVFEETDKGHGRVERRSLEVCRDLGWMMTADRWAGLGFVVKVTRERTVLATKKTSTETAYYIGSDTKIRAWRQGDVAHAGPLLKELVDLLPRLRAVILGGKAAQEGWRLHRPQGVTVREFPCPHPSVTNVNTRPEVWPAVVSAWRDAAAWAVG